MKRNNILISEDNTTKRIAGVKFTTGDLAAPFDSLIHFGKEGDDVILQNCHIKDTKIAKCSPKDTYDFETGALIALMKLCGEEKVKQASKEFFKDSVDRSNGATEKELELASKLNNAKIYIAQLKSKLGYTMTKEEMDIVNHPISNRDKLWCKYLSNDVVCIKVRRESINDFLKEAEENGVLWISGQNQLIVHAINMIGITGENTITYISLSTINL